MIPMSVVIERVSQSDVVVVGSGLYGLTCARLLAEQGLSVSVLDKRGHPGGNTYSYIDSETGIEIHKYGSHLFHTSNLRVWHFVNRFADFTNYRHRVFSIHEGRIFEMPPSLREISFFHPGAVSSEQARIAILEDAAGVEDSNKNFESKAISLVGEKIYRALIAGYTEKQWQIHPTQLPSSYVSRLPFRTSHETGYFSDTFQGLPKMGYGDFIGQILDHSNISVFLSVDFFDLKKFLPDDMPIIYSGPLDRYFDYSEGHLRWRTLDFEFEYLDTPDFQSTAVVNYADLDSPWTRIHEFKHLHPERELTSGRTVIAREFSREATGSDEPYYPVNSESDRVKLLAYRKRAASEPNVFFGGRLASYQYLDMHMAIAAALKDFDVRYRAFKKRKGSI